MNAEVKSPCIGTCKIDQKDICVGCYRSLEEIRQWRDSSQEIQRRIIALAAERKKLANKVA
ncbi:MAG: DUF1289 domain-containing protein [Arenicella sp.]